MSASKVYRAYGYQIYRVGISYYVFAGPASFHPHALTLSEARDHARALAARGVSALELAYRRALAREVRAVDALPERATADQLNRCWQLADETNAAHRALMAARGE